MGCLMLFVLFVVVSFWESVTSPVLYSCEMSFSTWNTMNKKEEERRRKKKKEEAIPWVGPITCNSLFWDGRPEPSLSTGNQVDSDRPNLYPPKKPNHLQVRTGSSRHPPTRGALPRWLEDQKQGLVC